MPSQDQAHSTTFVNRDADTPIVAEWLNDVNNAVYKPSLKTQIGGLALADFTIDHSTPSGRVIFADTNPLDWAGGPGRMTVDFEITLNSYLAANPVGHIAVVLRCDTAIVAANVRGEGALVTGNATGFAEPSDLIPTTMLETWMNGIGGAPVASFTFGVSDGPRSIPLVDGATYKMVVEATKTIGDNRYLRYRMWQQQAGTLKWLPFVDTGDVLDHNVWADLTHSGLAFGQVFEGNLVPWSVDIKKLLVTWGPADVSVSDQTSKLSIWGARLHGDLWMLGNGRTIRPQTDAGPSLKDWTAIQDQTLNSNTNFLAKPNGTGNTAVFGATNTSNPDTVYQLVTMGIKGGRGVIETLNRGSTDPTLDINIGAGVTAVNFGPFGMAIAGASKYIGQPSSIYANLLNTGGTNARAFANSGANYDIEATCVVGALAAFLGGAYNANNIENIVRPLACLLSTLIDEVRTLRKML